MQCQCGGSTCPERVYTRNKGAIRLIGNECLSCGRMVFTAVEMRTEELGFVRLTNKTAIRTTQRMFQEKPKQEQKQCELSV